ncbi:MAG: hypothetical protein HP497_03345 [Nitrospira sp.]|nr:hypothetical protein [Nitrospira sp.]
MTILLTYVLTAGLCAAAEDGTRTSAERVAEQAKAVWESGAPLAALELLDQATQADPEALALHKLRGDILATFRGPKEAVQAQGSRAGVRSGPCHTAGGIGCPVGEVECLGLVGTGQRGHR